MTRTAETWFSREDAALLILSTLLCSMAAWYILMNDPLQNLQGSQVVGELSTDGFIRRRRAGLLFWEELDDKSALYLRDTLVSPPQTSATIQLNNGTSITLEPNSMLQLKEVLKHNFEATVFYGAASQKKTGTSANRVSLATQEKKAPLAAIKKVVMKPLVITLVDELADLSPLIQRERALIERLREVFIQSGERAPIQKLSWEPAVPLNALKYYTLAIYLPKGARKLDVKKNQWVDLTWSNIPLPKVQYTVEFSPNPDFRSPVFYRTFKNKLPLQLTTQGTYYLRVRALHGNQRINSTSVEVSVLP